MLELKKYFDSVLLDIKNKIIERAESIISNFPSRYKNASLSDFNEPVQKICNNFINNGGFLFVEGGCGSGKTHLAFGIAKDMAINDKCLAYKNTTDLILEIKSSFKKDGISEHDIIKQYSKHPCAFDDIGSFKVSDFSIEAVYAMIDARYINEIPTVFISNLSVSEISKQMGDRIASRIASGVVLRLASGDRRVLHKEVDETF